MITPELPRAPISAPNAAAWATVAGVGVAPGLVGLLERRADGGQHVGAGVAVGDREHVERVDLVDVGLERGDRVPEGREEAGAVARPARHQATSVPLAARSEGPGSVEAGTGTGGMPCSWTRRPIRIETRSGSRPIAWRRV